LRRGETIPMLVASPKADEGTSQPVKLTPPSGPTWRAVTAQGQFRGRSSSARISWPRRRRLASSARLLFLDARPDPC